MWKGTEGKIEHSSYLSLILIIPLVRDHFSNEKHRSQATVKGFTSVIVEKYLAKLFFSYLVTVNFVKYKV